jgi:hypothetical protein
LTRDLRVAGAFRSHAPLSPYVSGCKQVRLSPLRGSFTSPPAFLRSLFRLRFLTEKLPMNALRNYTATGNALKLNLADSGRPKGYGPRKRPRRLARPRTPPFHGDNTGSNPVGDANKPKDLSKIPHSHRAAVKPFFWPPGEVFRPQHLLHFCYAACFCRHRPPS